MENTANKMLSFFSLFKNYGLDKNNALFMIKCIFPSFLPNPYYSTVPAALDAMKIECQTERNSSYLELSDILV